MQNLNERSHDLFHLTPSKYSNGNTNSKKVKVVVAQEVITAGVVIKVVLLVVAALTLIEEIA